MVSKTNIYSKLLVLTFLASLALPGILAMLPIESANRFINENRRLSPFPDINMAAKAIEQFPRGFERYFDDHFQLRDYLILGYNWIKIRIWKRSSNQKVITGGDGWLFLAGDRVLEDFLSMNLFSIEQLEARRKLLEGKRNWLAKRGIRYLFVVPPNKQSIYSEFMPKAYRRLQGQSRLDQLLAYMQKHSDVNILDLRQALREAKSDHQVFFRRDTHWNQLGGLIASREIFRAVNYSLTLDTNRHPIRRLGDYRVHTEERQIQSDLARLLGYPTEARDQSYVIEPKFELVSHKKTLPDFLGRSWDPMPAPFVLEGPSSGLRCVVFHDSFAMNIAPYFPEHFQRSLFVWQRNPTGEVFKSVVAAEHPDIVIEEVAERFLFYLETGLEYQPLG